MGQQPYNQDSLGDRPPEELSERERRDSIRQYLLGDLSEEGQEQIERQLLSRKDYFEELLIAEEELTDDFISDRLPDTDRAKFSHRFLAVPELRQDVRFAKALSMHAADHALRTVPKLQDERSPPFRLRLTAFLQRPAVGFSLAAALLLAVCVAAWMAAQNRRLRTQVEQLQTRPTTPPPPPQSDLLEQLASERERGEQLAAQLSREQEQRADAERKLEEAGRRQSQPRRDQASVSTVAAVFTLSPGLIREPGAGLKKVSIPPGGGRVLVRLDLAADDYRTYRATLKMVEGRELLSMSNLRARGGGKVIPFILPASSLTPDNDYQILLSGKAPTGVYEDVGTYHFRVVR